jgi:hypothetical protein
MRPESFQRLSAFCGIIGVVLLVTSFVINPGPGPNPTAHDLAVFGNTYHTTILLGAWLQAVSPFLIMIFALAAIRLAGAADSFPGQLTQVGFVVLVMVSLLEVVFYLSAVYGDPATTGLISLDHVRATQHLFSIAAAPAVFFPFGIVILRTGALPRVFGYTALCLASLFTVLGFVALFRPIQHVIDGVAFSQGIWWLLAATAQVFRASTHPVEAGRVSR